MNKSAKIFVAGHRGLVGNALCRVLREAGFENLVTATRQEVDLTNPTEVQWFFSSHLPEYVILSAARVGGIIANATYPVEFMEQNLHIELNVLQNAREYGVKKLLFLGSACAYPKFAENPIREDSLLTGSLEPSNECYALAKIAGIKLCDAYRQEYRSDFISAMPTNLYGIGDHYDLTNSHVIPGIMHRMHRAKLEQQEALTLWGSGKATREFLYADDLARACLVLMDKYSESGPVNVGGLELKSIQEIAEEIANVVGYYGKLIWDTTKPDGTPARKLDGSRMRALGWEPKISLHEGLSKAYEDFLCQQL